MALVARKGLPLPTLTNYDCVSTNPGSSEQLITLFDFSTPVALTPGDWFISAVNLSGGPVGYTMMATEFAAYGTDVVITNCQALTNSLCLTWTSMPGIHYYVEGKTNLNDTAWAAVSPTIVASDVLTTWCVALPSPCRFYRICEGLAPNPSKPFLRRSGINAGNLAKPGGYRLRQSP